MKKIICQQFYLTTQTQRICYRLYQNSNVTNKRKLLLVHGAGVAGKDTWANIVNYLQHWQWVLVPDLRGMGDTFSRQDLAVLGIQTPSEGSHTAQDTEQVTAFDAAIIDQVGYQVTDLVNDLKQLVDHLAWQMFDLGGYSLGGLIAMLYKQKYSASVKQQFLLEPGLLDRKDWQETKILRGLYEQSAQHIRTSHVRQGITTFLDTISPHRKNTPAAQEMAIKRLAYRYLGFANALDSVNSAIHCIDREQLVSDQGDVISFVGGLSVASMHEYHQHLSQKYAAWHYHDIQGTDHSLPYQKPKQIARIFNETITASLTDSSAAIPE